MAAWIKMSIGIDLGLGPGDFVLDGDAVLFPLPQKAAPNFRPMFIVAKCLQGWMKLVLGMEVGLSSGDFVLDANPAPSRKGGGAPLPNFRPISIVAKRLDASTCHLVWR